MEYHDKNGNAYVIYFGRVSEKRRKELERSIALYGISSASVVNQSFVSEFLARENLSLD